MDENDTILELLEIYSEMVERQDEIIYRLGQIVKRQATDLELLRNDAKFSDEKLNLDMEIVDEVIEQYKDVKSGLGDYQP